MFDRPHASGRHVASMAPGDQIEFELIRGRTQAMPKHLCEHQFLKGWKVENRTGKKIANGGGPGFSAQQGPNFVPLNFTPEGEEYEQVIKFGIGTSIYIAK